MNVFIEGVGLVGPGLPDWQSSQAVLAGTEPYHQAETVIPPCDLLPSAERRRTGVSVKLALAVGCAAIADAGRNASELPAVFASSEGDGDNMHYIFDMLANNGREVSPTRFHNSVHNAPSGYWSIATQSRAPSTSLACFDQSFVAGLIEAATQTLAGADAVVMISYDAPYPKQLHVARPLSATFGVAFVLTNNKTVRSIAELEISVAPQTRPCTTISNAELNGLRVGTPAARSLTLLSALAARRMDKICFDYVAGNQLDVAVSPCC